MEDIDVEYHDTSKNHGLRLNNVAGHTMAALTTQAVALACPRTEDGSPRQDSLKIGFYNIQNIFIQFEIFRKNLSLTVK